MLAVSFASLHSLQIKTICNIKRDSRCASLCLVCSFHYYYFAAILFAFLIPHRLSFYITIVWVFIDIKVCFSPLFAWWKLIFSSTFSLRPRFSFWIKRFQMYKTIHKFIRLRLPQRRLHHFMNATGFSFILVAFRLEATSFSYPECVCTRSIQKIYWTLAITPSVAIVTLVKDIKKRHTYVESAIKHKHMPLHIEIKQGKYMCAV